MRREETKVVQIGELQDWRRKSDCHSVYDKYKQRMWRRLVPRYWHWRQQDATLSLHCAYDGGGGSTHRDKKNSYSACCRYSF